MANHESDLTIMIEITFWTISYSIFQIVKRCQDGDFKFKIYWKKNLGLFLKAYTVHWKKKSCQDRGMSQFIARLLSKEPNEMLLRS